MKNSNSIILGIIMVLGTSCSHYPKNVEQALRLAGDNRTELERVLEHYRKDSKDILKYRAACFLITNTPFYSHIEMGMDSLNYKIFNIMKTYSISQEQALDSLRKKSPKLYRYKNDIGIINSDFLINNIEWAFKAWEESPWGKNVSFDHFCSEILPYRVGTEPLEEWREQYYNYFKPILDSLLKDNSPFSACQILYDTLIKRDWQYTSASYANLGANLLMKNNEGGHCVTQTQLMTFVMRSVGIPGGIDCYLCSPDKMGGGHAWNYFRDTTGNIIDFNFEPCDAGYIRDTVGKIVNRELLSNHIERMSVTRKKGKVYRVHFKTSDFDFSHEVIQKLPKTIQKAIRMEDVSYEYFNKNNISLKTNDNGQKLLFLCVFNDKEWVAVDVMSIRNGKVKLNEIESNVVFILASCVNNKIITIGNPFIYDGEKLNYLIADTVDLEQIALTRKYPISIGMERVRMYAVGGKFQVANNANFKNAQTVYTIDKGAEMMYTVIDINVEKKYRFVRYLSADNGFCCMAEMDFFSSKNERLKGSIIGTDGTRWGNEAHTKYAVFDKDPFTYFVSKEPSGAWVGLDLGQSEKIEKIRYLFRNDDNSIRTGDIYELFYFSPTGWVSCGVKQGQEQEQLLLYDNVPKNALLWLRNHTRGREERIFTYENGKQVFW